MSICLLWNIDGVVLDNKELLGFEIKLDRFGSKARVNFIGSAYYDQTFNNDKK